MGEYKPGAGLAGAKGFEKYVPIIAPKVSALAVAAPSFAKVASWQDTGYEAAYLSSSRPGGWTSDLPSMQQMVYQQFSSSRAGMGIYDPIDVPSFAPPKTKLPTRVWSTDIAVVDPFGSIENVTGDFLGLQAPLIGSGGQVADPPNWLGERDIGLENYPSRFLDYGFLTVPMIAAYMMGVQMQPGTSPKNADGTGFFPFENRPEYWESLKRWKNTGRPPTDDELLAEAKQEAAKVSMAPNLMVPALYERYKWGRDVMVNAMSSGNNRIDYMAKKVVEAALEVIRFSPEGTFSLFKQGTEDIGPIQIAKTIPGVLAQLGGGLALTGRSIFTLIPGIGTPLAETLMPVSDQAEEVWGYLSGDQRRDLLAGAGMLTMATDVVMTLPLLSGAGSLASALTAGAKGGDFMAWAAKTGMVKLAGPGLGTYERITTGWSTTRATMNVAKEVVFNVAGSRPVAARMVIGGMGHTLTVMDRLMAAGMASMLGNWALESMVPGYAEAVGYAIDNSRPFSGSAAAGVINNIGYFSSATGGAWTLARTTKALPTAIPRGIGKAGAMADRAGLLGSQELRGFAGHYGGMAKVRDAQAFFKTADGSPLTEAALTTPVKSDVFSMLGKQIEDFELARVQKEFIDNPALAHLDPQVRVDMANDALHTALVNLDDRRTLLAGILNAAKSPTSFMSSLKLTDEMRRTQNAVAKSAREIEDRMAASLSRLYSENRWNFRFRSLDIPIDPKNATLAYRGWLRQQAARMGWEFDEAAAAAAYGKDVNEWRQLANTMHANEFSAKNAQVMEAAKVSPTEFLEAHPEDYFLMRADHLFQDRADYLRAAISQRGTPEAFMTDDELIALVGREIRTTQELDEWWSRLRGKESPLSDDLVLRSEGIRSGVVPTPEDVDLDALLAYIEESYSILPGRHPHVTLDPLTADFPINALARQLHSEGLFSVAYKPKGSIIAYRPTAREMAVRVSRNPPAGYTLEAPQTIRDLVPPGVATGNFHVTADIDAVIAEGLKARTELIEEAGERLFYHGTTNAPRGSGYWHVVNPAYLSEHSLAGRGTYTTASTGMVDTYSVGASTKEFRIPGDARIWNTETPMDDAFIGLLEADLALGQQGQGRLFAAASRASTMSGGVRDPVTMLLPGGTWGKVVGDLKTQRGEYFDQVVEQGIGDFDATGDQFMNAVNDILADAGFDGLTHTGGRHLGGTKHEVVVLFDVEALQRRAKIIGTGAGGSDLDHGQLVSLVYNPMAAAERQQRLMLAVRASRGEATIEEIVSHYERAYATGGTQRDWRDIAGWLDGNIDDYSASVGQSPLTRDEFLEGLGRVYDPALYPEKMGELVLDLDRSLGRAPGSNTYPTDIYGNYDPDGWAMFSQDIFTPPTRLARIDPSKIGTAQVAMRTETPTAADTIPRLVDADMMTVEQGGWEKVMADPHVDEWKFRFVDPGGQLDDLIANGVPRESSQMYLLANDLNAGMAGLPLALKKVGIQRIRSEDIPYIEARIPSQLVEVLGADGTWKRLGAVDRLPNEPVPRETLGAWTGRLWSEVRLGKGVDQTGIEDAFIQVNTGEWVQAQRAGKLEQPLYSTKVRSFDDLMGTPASSLGGRRGDHLIEFDRSAAALDEHVMSAGMSVFSEWSLKSVPTSAVKRIWTFDDSLGKYVLAAEPRRYGLGPTDFYTHGRGAAEIQSRSNHLWTVDQKATSRHAGWTDDTPQPLDNQWEQPWAGLIEDPTAGATPVYRHVSHIKLRDGTVVQAPFLDYPMNPGDINLGNRTVMGRKYDSIFQGVRSWRMAEHHLAQMARVFGNRYGFSAQQIELYKNRVDHYSRSHGYSPIKGHGEVKITPYANARIRSDEVQKIGERTFGSGEVLNQATGKMEKLDYARLFADTHQQAWTLNLSSAITSRIKQFDLLSIGPMSTWIADWVVPMLRFKASTVFRTSELFESKVFASQRGVNVNAEERAAYVDAGLSPNSNLLSSDFGTDPMLESMMSAGQTPGAMGGMAGVNGLDDMLAGEGVTGFGSSYAIWRDVDDLLTKKGMAGLKEDIADPARYKNGLMFDQQVETIRRELPLIIKNRDPEAYRVMSDVLKVPDLEMARFIVDDRILYGRWQRGNATLEDLIQHSNTFAKQADKLDDATMKAIYETEDWKALDTLMRVASLSAQAEAFGTHYFGSYRSALERSINHPLLGIYPASWAYKSAKEWVAFLYDNRTFGHGQLRLGMFPAVAVNSLIKQVNMTVAMQTGEDWEDWLQNGPARNWLFLWNLLLPGDWSSLPLPVARPLRSISRAIINGEWEKLAPWNLAADTLMGPQGRGGIGIIRDMNLAARGLYDIYEYMAMDKPGQWDNLANGLSLDGVQQAPLNWSDLVLYPDPDFAPVNATP